MNLGNAIQAARGPILLITVGTLIVVDYNTPFGFSHTWPILIIVFGVLKLLERVAGPPVEPPYVPVTPVPPGFQAPARQAGPPGPGGNVP
jgi:hypothetical protein